MKYLDEFRDPRIAAALVARIRRRARRPWVLMEICGGQTHTLLRYGIDELLAGAVELVHGPGCPVCVTPVAILDQAIELALRPGVTLVSYGDMLRVPGSRADLYGARAAGGDVRIVYSPVEAVRIARALPERQVVFFAIGFETTAPANAMAVWHARRERLPNFSLLASHALVPPAVRLLLGMPGNRVQGLIAPGHVCTVMGCGEYADLVRDHRLPVVVGGFEPLDLLAAIDRLVALLEGGRAELDNQYARSVRPEGNRPARERMDLVFERCDRTWRGIGVIPASGLRLRPAFADFDAERRFGLAHGPALESGECLAAEVLQGRRKPAECPAFGTRCRPEHPLGAPMVSSEGACAAWHRYRRSTPASAEATA